MWSTVHIFRGFQIRPSLHLLCLYLNEAYRHLLLFLSLVTLTTLYNGTAFMTIQFFRTGLHFTARYKAWSEEGELLCPAMNQHHGVLDETREGLEMNKYCNYDSFSINKENSPWTDWMLPFQPGYCQRERERERERSYLNTVNGKYDVHSSERNWTS